MVDKKEEVDYTKVITGKAGDNYTVEDEKGIDYEKLTDQFGCLSLGKDLVERIAKATKQRPHRFLRRGIFFCHRDLEQILEGYETGKPFYLYTGRGPSNEAMHLGHAVPMIFTAWLQKAFGVPLVIQITDDEKFLFRPQDTLEKIQQYAISNIKDIIAFGFDPAKTFIFVDTQYIGSLYEHVIKIQKCVTFNQLKGIFGFNESSNSGMIAYPAIQAAPAFSGCFKTIFGDHKRQLPCLIPAAVDQDPFFRMTRDVCQKLHWSKPASIYSVFFPALKGLEEKMGGTAETTIMLTDTPQQVKEKVTKHAKSGGRATLEEHRRLGADLEVDIPYQWLRFFLEDDERLHQIESDYGSGKMTTGEVKNILVECLVEFLTDFQTRRAAVTDEMVSAFMQQRKIDIDLTNFKDQAQ